MTVDQNVLIIGGGPAGLELAHACQTHGVPYKLYERDATYNARAQGGSMMLYLALNHLRKCVTYPSAFENFGEKVAVNRVDPNLMALTYFDGETEDILNSIYEHIHFGKKFSHYENSEESVTVHFQDGTSVTGGILVGADGSLSSVCAQLVGGKDRFNEITKINPVIVYFISTWFTDEELELLRRLSECTGRGAGKYKYDGSTTNVFFTISDTDVTRKDGRHKEIVFNLSRYEDSEYPKFESDEECFRAMSQWVDGSFKKDGVFSRIFSNFNDETHLIDIKIRERTPSVEFMGTDKRVFIVGDAAHCMSMFRGEGGNHAIIDACVLGTELGQYYAGEKSLEEAYDAYFDEIIVRCANAVKTSNEAAKQLHTNKDEMVKTLKDMERKVIESALLNE